MCLHGSPYSLNCHGGVVVVICKLCRIARSSQLRKTESATAMGHAVGGSEFYRVGPETEKLLLVMCTTAVACYDCCVN